MVMIHSLSVCLSLPAPPPPLRHFSDGLISSVQRLTVAAIMSLCGSEKMCVVWGKQIPQMVLPSTFQSTNSKSFSKL